MGHTNEMQQRPPREVVYGLWREETFAVLDAGWATAAVAEFEPLAAGHYHRRGPSPEH
jgi:hypothetical protein